MKKILLLVSLAAIMAGCSTAYYSGMEKVGIHKRDILVDRVKETKESQVEGQEQFRDALERYKSVIAFDGGKLETRYNELKDEFEKSEEAAKTIRERIGSVEDVAEDLFDEWEDELDSYTSKTLKKDSQNKLKNTRRNYEKLIATMHNSEERLEPALNAMRDQVLYLKHNLNAKAIASLEAESATVTRDVGVLLDSMQSSIDEANRFLAGMED